MGLVINHLKELRQAQGITQVQMAADLNITRQTIIAVEKGKYNPSLELALKLIAYLNVDIHALFELEDEKNE